MKINNPFFDFKSVNLPISKQLEYIRGLLTTLISSAILWLRGKVTLRFIAFLCMVKLLRFLNLRWLVIPYSADLKYLVPLNQSCDWHHITTELLTISEQFKPRKGWTIIDAGSNIGLQALYYAKEVGEKGIVIAVEPEPRNFGILLYNKTLNNSNNVVTLNIAVSDHNGEVRLYLKTPTSHSIMHWIDERKFIEVPCKTLDKIISECNINQVDLLNLDVEGAALLCLKGCCNALKRKIIRRITIEIENEGEVKTLCEYLSNFSYKVFRLGNLLCAYLP